MPTISRNRWLVLCLLMMLPAPVAESHAQTGNAYTETDHITLHSEGVSTAGSLWLPDNAGRHPAIVIAHGSGRAAPGILNWMTRHFASMGMAVLIYDKRGVRDYWVLQDKFLLDQVKIKIN
jgi:cephalosporin-C deacetylase-like acetyl esterase